MKKHIHKPIPDKPVILSLNTFPVVGIGASAGGLDAFKKLLKAIPEDSGIAYVLVQHLDPNHESLLPELLQKVTRIPVLEITDDIKIKPDHIYIIPSNKMLMANDGVLQLSPRPAKNKNERNLPVDLFFASLAEVHQSHAIGVVLSGTASDGTKGLKAIKDQGGITFAQDEASAAFEGMPNSAVRAGVVDFILPPEKIPQKLLEIIATIKSKGGEEQQLLQADEDVFKQILLLLRIRKAVDFTYYKQTTIRRRILRRMVLNKNEEPAGYLKYLREHKAEQDILYQDLLIPVTSFFRDAKTFDNLCATVFPQLVKKEDPGEPIRLWVAGCSTGEEAYSMAICLKEFLGDNPVKVQVFATDLSEPAIAKARAGIYTKSETDSLSPQRLQAFFTKTEHGYQVNKAVRDLCVFAVHNFLKDPPFGKMDFISCRNVLIYMEPYLQKKALTTFHYALNRKGYLLLGKSETAGGVAGLFASAGRNDKLFTRKDAPSRFMQVASQYSEQNLRRPDAALKSEQIRTDFQKTADDIILSKYTPAGVVVNEAMDIVHFRGKTGHFLEQSPGKPSHNLLNMAKDGLGFELRNILHKAKKEKITVRKEDIPVQVNGSQQLVTIEALPLPNLAEPHYLILFQDQYFGSRPAVAPGNKKSAVPKAAAQDDKDRRIAQLERELAQTREDMRSITEDQEAVNEELQSANEEMLSSGEEMQSLNEELETSKEELQSTIEELMVVNQEMVSLNEQVSAARDYAQAIVSTTREPLLVLDKNLRVKTANRSFYKTYQVNESETEGKIVYDLGNRQWNIPALRTLLESILPEKESFFDLEVEHDFQTIGPRVMLLNAREMINESIPEKLILLSIEDITERKLAEKKLAESEVHFRLMADLIPEKITNSDTAGQLTYLNKSWIDYTGCSMEALIGWGWEKSMHPDELEDIAKQWAHCLETGDDLEVEHRIRGKNDVYKWHLSRSVAVRNDQGKITKWIGATTDMQHQKEQTQVLEQAVKDRTSELRQANEALRQQNRKLTDMNKEMESFTYISSHDLQEPLRKIQIFAGRILEKEEAVLSAAGKDHFHRMQDSASRMQTLIRDLLLYSRTSAGEQKFEKTDLRRVVETVETDFRDVIAAKKATIDIGKLDHNICVIPFQFQQMMHNLLENALKFSDPARPPHIVIRSEIAAGHGLPVEQLAPDKNYCHLSIADNGIGFEPEFKDKIFQVFQRLHGKGAYPGTGIGLSIVKKIVDNHNGFITAGSGPGEGARFDIYLPHPENGP